MNSSLRRILIGLPLPSTRIVHERLSRVQALAILSSDALSSVAYATEEILLVLVLAGSGMLKASWPIALAIAVLLLIVATSYYQTVHAYPTGGGAYTVSKENLGTLPSLVAGAALLTDYILTNDNETVISQLGRLVFGLSPLYYVLQAATALILLLAANTSYSDFPRLAMWMARDRFLPRQLANLGDRLVYANGILVLGAMAALLVIIFGARTHALIPLYAVGVFISFTLNQAGMVRHWLKLRSSGWRHLSLINGLGATATAVVLVVVTMTKFTHGAWVILLLIPTLILGFRVIHHHYEEVNQQLSLSERWPTPIRRHTIIVPVADLHRGVLKAVHYGQALGGDLHVANVEVDPEETARLQKYWPEVLPDVPLNVLPSPYRSVTAPLLEYIDHFVQYEGDYVTVLVPEFVPARWWHHLLHNETALTLKMALLYSRRNWRGRFRLITDVPFYLSK